MTDYTIESLEKSLEKTLNDAENWTLENLNEEQDHLAFRLINTAHVHFDTNAIGPVKAVLNKAFILEITEQETGLSITTCFGLSGREMIRTSDVISYNPHLKQIKTANSIYQIDSLQNEIFDHFLVWTHFCCMGIARAFPKRPQNLFF